MPVTGADQGTIYGTTANYFKIGQMYIDFTNNTGFVNYLGFESEKLAFEGRSHIKSFEIRLDPPDVTGVYGLLNSSGNVSATGSYIVDYFDTIITSGAKATSLDGKSKTNYPAGVYPCEECGGGFGT